MASIIYIAIYFVAIYFLLKVYSRLTVGRCHSRQYMSGKTVLITGASAGIGKATAINLARRNARVLLACRDMEKAEKVKSEIISSTGNTNVSVKHLDLESFDSVRKCAEDVLKTEKRLDVLINNAGIAEYELQLTKDGYEKHMQVNHFGHFLLTLLLLDLLKKSKPSRIINVSSILYLFGILNLDDINGFKLSNRFCQTFGSYYHRSKLANILFTIDLARRLDGTGITVNCLHPGYVRTNIFNDVPFSDVFYFLLFPFIKSIEEGAQPSIYAAVDPDLENVTGKIFHECKVGRLYGKARDKTLARKLFELSEVIVGASFENQ